MPDLNEIVQMLRVLDGSCKGESIRWVAQNAASAIEELLAEKAKIVYCENCQFWDSPPSCEGLAKCVTGETGIRYRSGRDFCSKGRPLKSPPKEVE